MVHSYGYKSGTRHLFAKKFRKHGVPSVSTILTNIKVGDYVDVVADSAVREGMPHKYYHGRTGIVWNVTPRGVGVIINKPVRTRTLRKRICVRFEHVRKSRCQEAFKAKEHQFQAHLAAKKAGKALAPLKKSSRMGGIVRPKNVEVLARRVADYEAMVPY
ncbi:putative 60S ribosomal protein L21 [Leishmania mexicana MHOM/GT/2001/U1103]|uniref:Putative 60S ribosomal protein L21 n=1 Tax=Leishmania mexicana (strain MHOM/GT/2001/U1103) TaxID=929439 RepID=E9AQK4_LEIMU|nr:putative 60S ribosomal protein L21 [Leishmania mexicana MHOM/GT/2001/U1103]XP_003878923.1 putative 60S ribosomal protein L21 [Leishmania mexicana MHOM/GT/2001/U1103]CBZ25223.1 putative 60S ribosomal protein L21 [Leishmania mexicana MHOM/GT/2001/U1103]CBZ30476.1 putative 60S ribosomal protein L21 [Leishmania mexicana MHOM/GT/2001/U1103]